MSDSLSHASASGSAPLIFHTPSELDIRALTTFGLSTKPNTTSPIGQFGTGLKYAIAGILRLGGNITIRSGQWRYEFKIDPRVFRKQEYQAIVMECYLADSNQLSSFLELPFTPSLGSHWKPWMFYRELWSNTHDEKGVGPVPRTEPIYPGGTVIIIHCDELAELKHSDYFLNTDPLWSNSELEIHPPSPSLICYQGIRMMTKWQNTTQALYTYNIIAPQPLTEDRTLASSYEVMALIAKAILTIDDRDIARAIIGGLEPTFERTLDYDWGSATMSEVMLTTAIELGPKRLPNKSFINLFKRLDPEGWLKAQVQNVPSTWDEALASAPPTPVFIDKSYEYYNYVTRLENALTRALRSERYWRTVASKLAAQPIPVIGTTEENESAVDEIQF